MKKAGEETSLITSDIENCYENEKENTGEKKNEWPEKFKMIAILATTKFLLSRSDSEGWGFEEPKKIEEQVNQILCFLLGDQNFRLPEHYKILFAPTGTVQEISIANGWSEVFLKLAAEYDKLAYLINEKQMADA